MSKYSLSFAAFLAVLAGGMPARLPAQQTLCFNGSPLPVCSSFVIVEMQGALPVLQSSRPVQWSWGPPTRERLLQDRPQWELGMMRNLSEKWAVGGVARLGPGAQGALTGLTARGRYWLTDDLGVDVSAGASFLADHWHGSGGRLVGPLADARLNFKDDFYAGVRWESFDLKPVNEPGTMIDPGGRQHALSLLLGTGSEWAMGASGLTGLALLWFLTVVDFS
jgi:hypothetical protein